MLAIRTVGSYSNGYACHRTVDVIAMDMVAIELLEVIAMDMLAIELLEIIPMNMLVIELLEVIPMDMLAIELFGNYSNGHACHRTVGSYSQWTCLP